MILPSLPSEQNVRPGQVVNASPSGTTDYPWTMFHYDQFRDGVTQASGPASATLMWSYTTGNIVYSSPVVSDGYVFIPSYDGTLYALDQYTGSLLWSFTTGGRITSTPAVNNGIVYLTSQDSYIYALNEQTGSVIWKFQNDLSIAVISSPVVADGKVFFGTSEKPSAGRADIYALDSQTGSVIWENTGVTAYIYSSASVSGGLVFLGAGLPGNAIVMALNETTGKQIWSYTPPVAAATSISTAPAAAYGNVYVGLDNYRFFALRQSTGSLVWSFNTPGGSNATTPAVYNHSVYFGTGSGTVYALNATTGATIWTRLTGGAVTSSPAISIGSDTLYAGSNDGRLYALNLNTGAVNWRYLSGGQVSSSPAVANNRVYFGAKDHKVYALGAGVPRLYVTLVSNPTTLLPGHNAILTITVNNGTVPTSNANLTLTSSAGGILSTPILVSAGTYDSNFTAPYVSSSTLVTIQVTASVVGYLSATSQTSITVDGPKLYDTIISNSTALEPGFNATLTITVRNSTALQSAAQVTLTSSTGGGFSQPVLVGPGTYQAYFTAPTVTSPAPTIIQVTASVIGYLSAINQTSITVNPFPTLTVAVSPRPYSITPGGEITLMIKITNGTIPISGATLQLSSNNGGGFSSVYDSGNGNYTVIFDTPLQASDPVVTVRASKAEFTSGQGQTTVQVNGIPNLTTLKLAGISFFLIVAMGTVLFLLILAVIVRRKKTSPRHYEPAKPGFTY